MAPVAKQYFERHSIASAIGTALNSNGWDIGQVREGFQSGKEITLPTVAVTNLPSTMYELQMGRSVTGEKSHDRLYQIDCYMESEARAMTIADDVADIIDQLYISIADPSANVLGTIFCPNSEEIRITLPPINPQHVGIQRWRAIIQAPFQAHYLE